MGTFIRRSTSPLHYEPLTPDPEDIIYPISEDEESPEAHRAKRQRIEKLGQQYLEGRPLLILSARLRGPFHTGWINPWIKKRRAQRSIDGAFRRQKQGPSQSETVAHSVINDIPSVERIAPSTVRKARKPLNILDDSLVTSPKAPDPFRATREGRRLEQNSIHGEFDKVNPAAFSSNRRAQTGTEGTGVPEIGGSVANVSEKKEKGWLKSDKEFLKPRSKIRSKSPTPTPNAPSLENVGSESLSTLRRASYRSDKTQRGKPLKHTNSFTPINRAIDIAQVSEASKQKQQSIKHAIPQSFAEYGPAISPTGPYEMSSILGPSTRKNDFSIKEFSQELDIPAKSADAYLKVRQSTSPKNWKELRQPDSSKSPQLPLILSHDLPSNIRYPTLPVKLSRMRTLSPHALPPSTVVPEFQYHRSVREPMTAAQHCSPVTERFEAAKAQAVEVQAARRRLSFTNSGTVKFGSRTASMESSKSPSAGSEAKLSLPRAAQPSDTKVSLSQPAVVSQFRQHSNSTPKVGGTTIASGTRSDILLPETQIVPEQAGQNFQLLSGPSTNMLETDKQSLVYFSTEGDSDIHLSTQAAMVKAQKSFQMDLLSPGNSHSEPSSIGLSLKKDTIAQLTRPAITPFRIFHGPYDSAMALVTTNNDEELVSTQAMVDALTPFAITTDKKPASKKKASFAPSPTNGKGPFSPADANSAYGKLGLDMETSPDDFDSEMRPLKPVRGPILSGRSIKSSDSYPTMPSTSLSTAPFGAASEGYQQDGQVPQSSWNLNAAIDDAGSFLGNWDVEHEIRRGSISAPSAPLQANQ
ncbi:hypothetical protein MMC06_002714, partial [Schaereria dolodes]|nr:hypothetical protein [Schaereria dolodes]